jgi:hypothetical protein
LNLSSRYFLKRSKTDISRNVKFPWVLAERSSDDLRYAKLFSAGNHCPEVRGYQASQRLSIVNPMAMLETERG